MTTKFVEELFAKIYKHLAVCENNSASYSSANDVV